MADSRFWRLAAVLLIAALFYIGRGLNGGSEIRLPTFQNDVFAGDIAMTPGGAHSSNVKIVTTSDNGKTLHVWSSSTNSSQVAFRGTYTVPNKPKK